MQGFNMGRYYPPDASNPPVFNQSSHPLGKRANKITQGILTVRFELPFAVWCEHCKPAAIVGQGVRFNAEKKKVGNYYSTPVWSFRMKHSACGGWWEIRTDPKNADYIITDGAKKRDYGPEDRGAEAEGELKFLTAEEREQRRNDAFANFEGKIEDKGIDKKNRERVEELYDKCEVWKDPYDVNARLRKGFRDKRKVWKKEEQHKKGIQDKFSLGIDIEHETEPDRIRAHMVEFKGPGSGEQVARSWKPLFESTHAGTPEEPTMKSRKLESESKAERSRKTLQQAIVDNTKATIDPFLKSGNGAKIKPTFSVLKRKRHDTEPALPCDDHQVEDKTLTTSKKPALLVEYDSD